MGETWTCEGGEGEYEECSTFQDEMYDWASERGIEEDQMGCFKLLEIARAMVEAM